jgi:hypothetical protein
VALYNLVCSVPEIRIFFSVKNRKMFSKLDLFPSSAERVGGGGAQLNLAQ